MKKYLIFTIILCTAQMFFMCSDNPLETKKTDPEQLTNQEFTFTKYFLRSPGGGSGLNDVWIFDDNDIWIVGGFTLTDTVDDGVDSSWYVYSMLKWDGISWKPERVYYHQESNNSLHTIQPKSIWVTENGDIYLTSGHLMKYNPSTRIYDVLIDKFEDLPNDGGLRKVWASSSNDVWACGWNGTLVHYNGFRHKTIYMPANLELTYIYGIYDAEQNISHVLLSGHRTDTVLGLSSMFYINSADLTPVEANYTEGSILVGHIWINSEAAYLASDGVQRKAGFPNGDNEWIKDKISTRAIYGIHGQSENDIAVCGGVGELMHYNGENWKSFIYQSRIYGNYGTVKIGGNTIVATGFSNNYVCFIRGTRNQKFERNKR